MFEITNLPFFEIVVVSLIIYLFYRTSARFRRLLKKSIKMIKKPITANHGRPDKINRIIISLINKERKKRNLHPVIFDKNLRLHARRWSGHMAHRRTLMHSNIIPENCAMVPSNGSPASIARSCFRVWMKSDPHRAWMLQEYNAGIGGTVIIHYVGFAYRINGKYAYAALAFK